MNMLRISVIVGFLCLIQGAASASLVLLHDNGGPLNRSARISDPTYPSEIGDDFSVIQPSKVTRLTWYGAYAGGDMLPDGSDHFSIRFYTFNGPTTPNPTPFANVVPSIVSRAPTSLTIATNNASVFYYEADFSEVGLFPGHYLMSIVNDTAGQPEQWMWSEHSSVAGNQSWLRFGGTNWAGPYGAEMSFKIYAVPEPGVVSGVLVFGALLLRRRGRA